MLNKVSGGDTFIYDREWRAPADDLAWRKEFPKYAYDPKVVDARCHKVMSAIAGDLTLFNPRYVLTPKFESERLCPRVLGSSRLCKSAPH